METTLSEAVYNIIGGTVDPNVILICVTLFWITTIIVFTIVMSRE